KQTFFLVSKLVSISSTYYNKLAPCIEHIFNITAKAVREDEEPVTLQAIEFWSSICDEEIDILEEYGGDSDIRCFYFVKQAISVVVPMLLETLLKQEEDQDQDEGDWNLASILLVARTVGDDIILFHLTPYFQNIVEALLTVTHREDAGESHAFALLFMRL
ncbi:Importin subunit beta-1, partial [Thalictrum thalictroides]